MISKAEIMEFSKEFGLAANIIEKDYVLGWILAGIYNHIDLNISLTFKGGTCLRKCYFETYRFSEDLDFTVIDQKILDKDFLENTFHEIAIWIYDTTGIEILPELIRFDIYDNPRGIKSVEGRVHYRGPMQRKGDPDRIKLDLSFDELLVQEPEIRKVHHPYSDLPEDGIHAISYKFEELFAEKIRALGDRLRPRDLYDVVHLYRNYGNTSDRELILNILKEKCKFKELPIPNFELIENKPEKPELETEWDNMLGHQLPELPPFEYFWDELPEIFEWLYREITKVILQPIPLIREEIDETWHIPPMAQAWYANVPLEKIRFAAANRLCVNLYYQGSSRLIEPYSLRRTRDGNLILYAVKHSTGEDRSYRVDRIQGAQVSKTTFKPKYKIELTQSGPVSAPLITRSSNRSGSVSSLVTRTRTRRSHRKRKSSNYGPKYVFKCPVCGKQFTRKSYNSSLNQHKNKNGFPCYGRNGMYVKTKFN